MALRTAIIDKGQDQPRKMPNGWGWWHVERMVEVIQAEVPEAADEQFFTALDRTPHIVVGEWKFIDTADGEVFILSPGDMLNAWADR